LETVKVAAAEAPAKAATINAIGGVLIGASGKKVDARKRAGGNAFLKKFSEVCGPARFSALPLVPYPKLRGSDQARVTERRVPPGEQSRILK
jgi:hypothetical protein